MTNFSTFIIKTNSSDGCKAAEIFREEIKKRNGKAPDDTPSKVCTFFFNQDDSMDRDSYNIRISDNSITFTARGIRGFMYAIGMFLRKTVYKNGQIFLIEDISGDYSPYMKIRGHQLGWRTTSNTYEAWNENDYYAYIKELMFFGCNTFEHTVFDDEPQNRNALMQYSETEFISRCNKKAKELDMDISYWYPNDDKVTESSAEKRYDFFKAVQYGDIYFPPGGDPGELNADEFINSTIETAKKIRTILPDIKIYPSAQSPHGFGEWGDVFIEEMKKLPQEIDGIITGPNCAMPLHELRKRLPKQYPIRLYPDITHNLRCEYPVHFDRDDWHYSLSSTLSREAINPRPTEYRKIHRMTRQYIIGSVSYSEGINDDINKFVWSDLDFFPDTELCDTIADYARLFFPGADTQKAVNGIFGLEKNWEGDPAENPHIGSTHQFFEDMQKENPELSENARFLMCLFRAKCDLFVKIKRTTENKYVRQAKKYLAAFDIANAEKQLNTPLPEACRKIREDIERIGEKLFKKVGLQLDTKRYSAKNWERGATLDTIDNPVSDRLWLLDRLRYAKSLGIDEQKRFISSLLNRNTTKPGEYYFSFAENSFTETGAVQEPFFYMDFQGDRPNVNNGSIPMSMLKVFDHYSFRLKTGGLNNSERYRLMLNIKPRYNDAVTDFTIKINGNVLYQGKQYGGIRDERFEKELSAPGFEMHVYDIPPAFIENGCVEIEITEPLVGIMLSELFIVKEN